MSSHEEQGSSMTNLELSQMFPKIVIPDEDATAFMSKPKATKAKKHAAKYMKAPGAPRRFKTAFIFFSSYKHKEIRKQLGDEGNKAKV